MAIGVLFEFPGGDQAHYDEVINKLTGGQSLRALSQWPVPGVLAHIAGPTPTGWRVVDVWESEEAFLKFATHVAPLNAELGFGEVKPQIFPLHNFVKS
jgi:hypothetical protein